MYGQVEAEHVDRLVDVGGVQLHVVDAEDGAEDPLDHDRHRERDEDRHPRPVRSRSRRMKQNSIATPSTNIAGIVSSRPGQQADPEVDRQLVAEVRAEDDHHALGDVDDVHDAEDQRQTGGHQRVDAAGQDSIDDRVEKVGRDNRASPSRPASGYTGGFDPAAVVGSVCTDVPFCHWNVSVFSAVFCPR